VAIFNDAPGGIGGCSSDGPRCGGRGGVGVETSAGGLGGPGDPECDTVGDPGLDGALFEHVLLPPIYDTTNQEIREYTQKHHLSPPEDAQHLRKYINPVPSIAKMESTLVEAVDAACNPWIPRMAGGLST
jgi:hypothetical protein